MGSSLGFLPCELSKGCILPLHAELTKEEETGGLSTVVEQREGRAEASSSLSFPLQGGLGKHCNDDNDSPYC